MNPQIEALVLDDDIWSLRLVKAALQECFPEVRVHTREVPDISGDFDLYFIDNDFNGTRVLPGLAAELRERRPDSLIIAFSATLDAPTLKALLNAGCDGACDKSVYGDLDEAMSIVRAYVDQRNQGTRRHGAIQSIRELLREWNRRLEHAEAATKTGASAGESRA